MFRYDIGNNQQDIRNMYVVRTLFELFPHAWAECSHHIHYYTVVVILFCACLSKQRVDANFLNQSWPDSGANLFLEHYDRVAPFFKENMVLLYALHQT